LVVELVVEVVALRGCLDRVEQPGEHQDMALMVVLEEAAAPPLHPVAVTGS
jgi:hypothetical protein